MINEKQLLFLDIMFLFKYNLLFSYERHHKLEMKITIA